MTTKNILICRIKYRFNRNPITYSHFTQRSRIHGDESHSDLGLLLLQGDDLDCNRSIPLDFNYYTTWSVYENSFLHNLAMFSPKKSNLLCLTFSVLKGMLYVTKEQGDTGFVGVLLLLRNTLNQFQWISVTGKCADGKMKNFPLTYSE